MDKEEILSKAAENDKLYKERYFVIKYLRDRGYIVRPSLDGSPYLRLHRKGYRPGEDKTYYFVHVVSNGWSATPDTLIPLLETAGKLRKELAIAVVDLEREAPLFIKFGRMNFE